MRASSKYLVAVALLAVLAVVFGLAGTVAPVSESVAPQSSSSSYSLTHFMNPPTYDSDWTDITDKRGQFFNVTHDLNTTEALVDVVGRQSLTGGDHKLFLDTTIYIKGFNQTYGGAIGDYAYSVVQTSDGGYAIAGYTTSFGAWPYADFYLVKTDSTGNMEWSRRYGAPSRSASARSIVQTSDGGYAMGGTTDYFDDYDFWLVKTNSTGNELWNQIYGGANDDVAYSMAQTGDGGYVLAGYTESYGAGGADFYLVKTDSAGNKQLHKSYGGTNTDIAYSVVQTGDGGYALAGYTESYGAGMEDFWLAKTYPNGDVEWSQTYGGGSSDVTYSVVQTADVGYALAGSTNSSGAGNRDSWLVKTDSAGVVQWNQTYGGANDDVAYSVAQTDDSGYVLAGYTESYGAGGSDFWLVKTDSAGNALWNQTYGGAIGDYAYSVVQTGYSGYVLAGYTESYGAGGSDFWLLKTTVEFGSSIGLSMTEFTNSTITLYRGRTDPYWNYLRVRIWTIEEPTWMFGDINQDGVVDAQDLLILSQNYGKTFSLLSLSGIVAVAGIHTYKKRKQPK